MLLHSGSSPRPWGTPACWSRTPASTTVHPHARGERMTRCPLSVLMPGSSPRPWGTLGVEAGHQRLPRFIPTPVGNAPACWTRRPNLSVHPHARGERAPVAGNVQPGSGSSPRPWGTPTAGGVPMANKRFIPTPVGNAHGNCDLCFLKPVHPHARGERDELEVSQLADDGSSPRPWGTPQEGGQGGHGGRFIPTPVGNAHLLQRPQRVAPVHPHARGERR